jgi:hypothetical protein
MRILELLDRLGLADAAVARGLRTTFPAAPSCGTEPEERRNLALAEGRIRGSGATTVRPVLDVQPDHCCVVFLQTRTVRHDGHCTDFMP